MQARLRVKAVLFDLDGTILESMETIIALLNAVFIRHGAGSITYDEFRASFYMPFEDWCLARGPGVPIMDVLDTWERLYDSRACAFYPGAAATVQELARRGLAAGIVSGSDMELVRYHVEQNGIAGDLVYVHGGDGRKVSRMLEFCSRVGCEPDEALYVGDTASDMRDAHEAGLVPVGITWGSEAAGVILEDAGAAHVISHIRELVALVAPIPEHVV